VCGGVASSDVDANDGWWRLRNVAGDDDCRDGDDDDVDELPRCACVCALPPIDGGDAADCSVDVYGRCSSADAPGDCDSRCDDGLCSGL
jgi:hypothetical protein